MQITPPRWLPQVEGYDADSEKFCRWRYKGLSPVGLTEIQEGDNGARNYFGLRRQNLGGCQDLHTETNNFAPNEYRGVVNSSGLAVSKGSTQEIIVQLKVRTESKFKV